MIDVDAASDAGVAHPRLIDWKLAAKVVVGFWVLHLAYRTLIALVGDGLAEVLDPAIDSALFLGFLLSFPFCAILALAARRGLAFALGLAAVLSLPTSLLYASIELAFFYHLSPVANGGTRQQVLADGTVVTVDAAGNASYMKPGTKHPIRVKLPSIKQQVLDRAVQTVTQNTSGWYFFYFGLGSFFVGMSNAARLRRIERRAAEYQRLAQQAQLQALRYQINPHFLFNTLNSLSALILAERVDAAETMILNLSRFFRSTLALDPAGDIPLSQELDLQRLYLDIEAVRFPERLRMAIDAPDDLLRACVPALLLQPLVENAIKHGVARRTGPTTIAIVAQQPTPGRLAITVANEVGERRAGEEDAGTGTGLRNVEQRLRARFGEAAGCAPRQDGAAYSVTATLPLIVA